MAVIRLGAPADLSAATGVYRRASWSNPGGRDNLLAHPERLILGPEELAEGRTYVAEEDERFYVRAPNAIEELTGRSLVRYIHEHWPA